jgi:hypothetical protein
MTVLNVKRTIAVAVAADLPRRCQIRVWFAVVIGALAAGKVEEC